MANNFQRMGDMVDVFSGLSRELADIRANMVSRGDIARLSSRVGGLESGVQLENPVVTDGADESGFWSRRYAEYEEGFSDYDCESEEEYDDDVSGIDF